jgi:hypothetical protein
MNDHVPRAVREISDSRDLVRGLNSVPLASSDELVVRTIAAAFARTPLGTDELRDTKLLAFVMEVDSGRLTSLRVPECPPFPPVSAWVDRLSVISGLSKIRVNTGIRNLVDAGVLVPLNELGPGRFDFSARVVMPMGTAQYIAWPVVLPALSGRAAALLVLRAVIDLTVVPWEWTRLTHEAVAEHACYSIGMVQKGLEDLTKPGILERSVRAGRGHDYRFSSWALGRGPVAARQLPLDASSPHDAPPDGSSSPALLTEAFQVSRKAQPEARPVFGEKVTIQVGGVVMQLPAGTEIRMSVDGDGAYWYDVGPDFKVKSRV